MERLYEWTSFTSSLEMREPRFWPRIRRIPYLFPLRRASVCKACSQRSLESSKKPDLTSWETSQGTIRQGWMKLDDPKVALGSKTLEIKRLMWLCDFMPWIMIIMQLVTNDQPTFLVANCSVDQKYLDATQVWTMPSFHIFQRWIHWVPWIEKLPWSMAFGHPLDVLPRGIRKEQLRKASREKPRFSGGLAEWCS